MMRCKLMFCQDKNKGDSEIKKWDECEVKEWEWKC